MTTPITTHSIHDGVTFSVSELLGMPELFIKPILEYITDWDLASAIFEDVGDNNGSIAYEKDVAPFTVDGLETIAEFAEYPSTLPVSAGKIVAAAEKEGRWLDISYEMRDENKVDQVNRSLTQFRNAATYSNYERLKSVLEKSDIGTVAAAAGWRTSDADIFGDTDKAIEKIADAEIPDVVQSEATYGFDPTAMVVPRSLASSFIKTEELRSAYEGNLDNTNPVFAGYKGVTARGFNGLQIIIPKFWYKDRILVIDENNKPGLVSHTKRLEMTGPFDEPRHDKVGYKLSQKRVLAVHNPKAAAWITGIKG